MGRFRNTWALSGFVLIAGLLVVSPAAWADEPALTLPDSGATGPVATYHSPPMQSNALGDSRCSGEIAGWERANPADNEFSARRLEGEVVIGHPPHGDAFFNHHTEDYNFFRSRAMCGAGLVVDPRFRSRPIRILRVALLRLDAHREGMEPDRPKVEVRFVGTERPTLTPRAARALLAICEAATTPQVRDEVAANRARRACDGGPAEVVPAVGRARS